MKAALNRNVKFLVKQSAESRTKWKRQIVPRTGSCNSECPISSDEYVHGTTTSCLQRNWVANGD